MSTHTISVKGKSLDAARTEINVRDLKFLIDKPVAGGGRNEAPNPVEYFLSAYAGCLNIVAHIVAKERNLPVASLHISVEGDFNPEKLRSGKGEDRTGFQEIRVELDIDTTASESELNDLIREVKARCPIEDNLLNPTPVLLTLTRPVSLN